jgi:hypothetical protein
VLRVVRLVSRLPHVPSPKETRVSHRNAPLTAAGRLRLVQPCRSRAEPAAAGAASSGQTQNRARARKSDTSLPESCTNSWLPRRRICCASC